MELLPAFVGAPEVGRVYHCDALTLMRHMPDASVDLIATDPPFNIGKASWDSWSSLDSYLAWLDTHLREFRRVLKPNGSLYLFCATKYAARVELAVGAHFNVLNAIRWQKPAYSTKAEMFDKESMRAFFPASETVIFAEQWGADGITPLGDRIRLARDGAGLRGTDVDIALGYVRSKDPARGTELCRRWEEGSSMPTALDFTRALKVCGSTASYEDLRREYEDLRRPFYATADAPYTDVWDFATVNTYPGKHICEKPLDMCQHIIRVSSRPDALVLDPFCGSGNMLRAAMLEGRRYIGGDADLQWAERSRERLRMPFEKRQRATVTQFDDLPLFASAE